MAEVLDCANLSVTLTETLNGTETGRHHVFSPPGQQQRDQLAARIFFSLPPKTPSMRRHSRLAQNTLNRFT